MAAACPEHETFAAQMTRLSLSSNWQPSTYLEVVCEIEADTLRRVAK